MIKTKADLVLYLKEDAKANRMEKTSVMEYLFRLIFGSESAHIYRYLKTLRYCEYHSNNGGVFHKCAYYFFKLKLHRMGLKYNIRIPENVCGYGLTIFHIAGCGGCLINAKKVGNYCKLQTGVLLGNAHHSEEEKPIVGDFVEFGPGSIVLGKVKVGDHSIIGANAVVTSDIPENVFAAGVPAKIIKRLNGCEV